MSFPDPHQLEKFVHDSLHDLPSPVAPETLMSKVQAAITARAARPWWQKGFSAWPVACKILFLVLSGAVAIWLVLAVNQFSLGEVSDDAGQPLNFFASFRELAVVLMDAAVAVFHAVPVAWLYGAAGFFVIMYALLLGMGTACYRSLWRINS